MPTPRSWLPSLLLLLSLPSPDGRAAILADSRAQFTGVQGEGGWTYGYRDLSLDGGAENYDPTASFIPFRGGPGQGAYNGATQQFNAESAVQPMYWLGTGVSPPWIRLGADYAHPNASPEQWSVRRLTLVVPSGGRSYALTWTLRKYLADYGNGVTGAIHIDGQKADEAVIPYYDTTGLSRTWYHYLPAGTHTVDLVLKAKGTDGANQDTYDGTSQSLVVSDSLPAIPLQPDGSLFVPRPIQDTDADGLPDTWELFHAGNLTSLAAAPADRDGDGLDDAAEYAGNTSPMAGNGPIQRWSFNERPGPLATAELRNEVTSARKAVPRGWGLHGTGRGVSLPGGHQGHAGYIDLPNGLVSGYDSCTIEGWVSVDAEGNSYARVFDFGDSEHKEIAGPGGVTGQHTDTLVYSASDGANYGVQNIGWIDGSNQGLPATGLVWVRYPAATPQLGRTFHFALTVEKTGAQQSRINFWRDGVRLVSDETLPITLANLRDVNTWLGRSQHVISGNLAGTFDEFRIHPRALNEAEILASRTAGPDAGLPDADADGLPDYWEEMFTTPASATALPPGGDADGDGLTALLEYGHYCDPTRADTDGDGRDDGAEVTAGSMPNLADLAVVNYTGTANPGSWHDAANWHADNGPDEVPGDTASRKFSARLVNGYPAAITSAVEVTDFSFAGTSRLQPAGPGASLTVTRNLSIGGEFRDMGVVTAGTGLRGGIQIDSASVFWPQSNWLTLHNTTLVNKGPDGIMRGEESLYFLGGARLENEGILYFPLNPTLRADDADPGNALVNRGAFVFAAPGRHSIGVNTRTEGGAWDVRSGTVAFTPVFNGVGAFHPGSVSHAHDQAVFRLAEGASLELGENTTTTLRGETSFEGGGSLVLNGGQLDSQQAALHIPRLVLEHGTLTSPAGSTITIDDLEYASGTIDFDGTVRAAEFRVPNRQNYASIVLKKVNLEVVPDHLEWNKAMMSPFPVDPLKEAIALGDGATFRVKSSQLFEIKRPFKVVGLGSPAFPAGGEFLNEGHMVNQPGGSLLFFVPFNNSGKLTHLTDDVLTLANGGENRDTGAPDSGILDLRARSSIALSGGVFRFAGVNPRVVTLGPDNYLSVSQGARLEVAPGAQASIPWLTVHTLGGDAGLKAGAGATLTARDLRIPAAVLRGPGTITTGTAPGDGLRLLAGGGPDGSNGDTFLLEGVTLRNAGPAGLIDKGWDGGVSYSDGLIIDEGCTFINLPGATIEMKQGLDIGAWQYAPGLFRGGSFINRGRLVKTGGGQSYISREISFINEGSLEIGSGEFFLPGRIQNDGSITVRGDGVTVDVPELGIQGPGIWRIELGALFKWGPAAIMHLNQIHADASRAYGAGPIRAEGLGARVTATGPGSKVEAPTIEASGASSLIAASAGGQIVAPGAGGGIVTPGAGAGIVAVGAGAGIVAAGAGIVAPGAGGGIVGAGAGAGALPRDTGFPFALAGLPVGTNTAGMVRATGVGSFIRVENQGLIWADVGIQSAPSARMEGDGVLQAPVVNPQGVFSPGHATRILQPARPVARLDIDGALLLESTSRFEAEIGGPAAGTGHDQARVTGAATLAGELRVTLRDGFTPAPGQTFTILDANAVGGAFSNIAPGARLNTGDGRGSFVVSYGSSSVFDPSDVVISDFQPDAAHPPLTFPVWSAAAVGAGPADPGADHEPDGIPDGLEYALGGNPLASGDGPAFSTRFEVIDGVRQWVVEYSRAVSAENAGARYFVQYSTDLSTWRDERNDLEASFGPAFFQIHEPVPGLEAANGLRRWRARCPADAARFMRLLVTLP